MPLVRNCPSCGKANRVPARHLADTGRCGACKSPLPPVAEPLEVGTEEFDDIIRESINGSGAIGIGFSLFIVAIAALNLVLDFDFIERGVNYGAPRYMEWYGAFGIMVTLVWLYLEMLRLLAKTRSRD